LSPLHLPHRVGTLMTEVEIHVANDLHESSHCDPNEEDETSSYLLGVCPKVILSSLGVEKPSIASLSASVSHIPISIPKDICDEFNVQKLPSISTRELAQLKIEEENIVEGPFYIVDLGVLARQYEQWVTLLPRVKPFYAVKCNPEPALIKVLAALGAGFDCASQAEIMQVLSYGVEPEKIIMANPCKPPSHIVSAKNLGVAKMTFDNADELHKIKKTHPQAELVLRILPDDSHSLMRFGSKFGAPPSTWPSLFKLARDLALKIVGVSFHVGSGCMSAVAFTEALRLARHVFNLGESYGFAMNFLDIGGGFPGQSNVNVNFPEIALAMSEVIDELFPPHIQVIGEPGRYMACDTHTLACSIYARRHIEASAEVPDADETLKYLYYINDGVYGSFNCIFFDHCHPVPIPLKNKPGPAHKCKIFGPTCDSMDVVASDVPLPEMSIGDWLIFEAMGAYTTASSSRFNGFKTTTMFFVYTIPQPFKSD